ncbi:MAG: carbohydrate ABC transporter permease [Erysipelotrichales bacterium]|nr:carbohydrate ABC transporter permease [Erysipelotrichales bacterium]
MKENVSENQEYSSMTTKEYFKMRYDKIRSNLSNPIKRKVFANNTSEFFISIFRAVLLFGFCFIILFPIFQKLSLSVRIPADIANPAVVFIPTQLSLMNYRLVILILNYGRGLLASFSLATIVMFSQLAISSIAGYAFARLKFRGSGIIFVFLILMLLIPPQVLHVSRVVLFTNLGLRGRILALPLLTLLGVGLRTGLFIFMFRQFFAGLPKELEESAQVDGAGVFRTFFSVMLPNARGIILSVGLFAFVWQWNDRTFDMMLNLSSDSFPLLPSRLVGTAERLPAIIRIHRLERYVGEDIANSSLFMGMIINTAALMVMGPLLILYLFVQKQFIEGVERSGITG